MEAINNREVGDDKVEILMQLWKERLKHVDEMKLRQNAEILVEDISNFVFDFSSNAVKYEVLGNKFIEIVNFRKDDEIPAHVDVYCLHSNIMVMFGMESREKEAFSMIFEISDDDRTRDISLMNEFLAARYLMRNINDLDRSLLEKIFSDASYKNVRNFMNGVLKHETFSVELSASFEINESMVHKCVEDKLIFLLDLMLEKLKVADSKEVRKILNHTDVNGNNIFHLACANRIKFLIENLWTLMQNAFNEDVKDLVEYLLAKNKNDMNAFQLAFEMPLKYSAIDYAHEIKNKETLFRYYRARGPIELEMYNFESCLNLLYDIARRNIPEKNKKALILNRSAGPSKRTFYDNYTYSNEFSAFRFDFLQLRYYCISKLSSLKPEDLQRSSQVYYFLSHYVEKFMSKLNEDELMEVYIKLSFDTFMEDFFKVLLKHHFSQALMTMQRVENVKKLFEITSKALGKDYQKALFERGQNGNNTLQWAISSSNMEIFKLTFEQIQEKTQVMKWIELKNLDRYNSLYLIIANKEYEMLQVLLEYFSKNLTEKEILQSLEQATKKNYKFFDICVLLYSQSIFNLVWNFVDAHMNQENQRSLIGETIVSLAVSKWQESATKVVLDLIASLFDAHEIKQFLTYKNREDQTAFHIASKKSSLSQLQMLCKFAHAFLTKEDFIELISHVDANEWSVINPNASEEDVYNLLPNVSNFSSDRPFYEWAPLTNFSSVPKNAVEVCTVGNETFYVGKFYTEEDAENFKIMKASSSIMIEDGQLVDILVGQGVKWLFKDLECINEIKLERPDGIFLVTRKGNEIELVSSRACDKMEVLALDQKEVYSSEKENWLFRKVY